MAIQVPPPPTSVDVEVDAGVIRDARSRQLRHRGISIAVTAAAVAAGLTVGLSGGGGGSGHHLNTGALGPKAAATIYDSHRVPNVLLKRYRILKTHRVSPGMLPADTGVKVMFGLAGIHRPGPSTAQRLGLDTSDIAEVRPARGVRIWLIPGIAGLCGFERENGGGFGSCGAVTETLGPGSTGTYPGGAEAIGFAPNAVEAVVLHLNNGSNVRVPVKDNTYFKKLHGDVSITGVTPASSTSPIGNATTN